MANHFRSSDFEGRLGEIDDDVSEDAKRLDEEVAALDMDRALSFAPSVKEGSQPDFELLIYRGDFDGVRRLVEGVGVDVNQTNGTGMTPLMAAASLDDDGRILRYLIAKKAKVDACDEDGCSSLFYAIIHDNVCSVECLLRAGANPNLSDKDGETPLTQALRHKELASAKIVKKLLQAGADVFSRNKAGESPLDRALATDNPEIIEMVVERMGFIDSSFRSSMKGILGGKYIQ